jgi:hypothetical protein
MNNFSSFLSKNKPGLLIGFGLGSLISATFFGIRYAPEAKEMVEIRKKELNTDKLETKELISEVLPYYIPSLIFTGIGITSILCGNQINIDRSAAAMAAYTLSETALREYREKTKEIVGEKKEKDIREAIAKDTVDNNPVKPGTIIITGNGDCLCFDSVANQYFKSSKVKIESLINSINFDMLHGQDVMSLNEYCIRLGLDEVELGNNLGWDVSSNGLISVSFTAVLAKNGEPCLVIAHNNIPEMIN